MQIHNFNQNKSVMINQINYSKQQTSLSWNWIKGVRLPDVQQLMKMRNAEGLVLYKGGGIINHLHFGHCCYYGQATWRQKSVWIFQPRNLGGYWVLQEKMVQDSRKMVEHLNSFGTRFYYNTTSIRLQIEEGLYSSLRDGEEEDWMRDIGVEFV